MRHPGRLKEGSALIGKQKLHAETLWGRNEVTRSRDHQITIAKRFEELKTRILCTTTHEQQLPLTEALLGKQRCFPLTSSAWRPFHTAAFVAATRRGSAVT